MKLYRCHPCGKFEFTADRPVCPQCGTDGDDPRIKARGFVIPLVILHFDPPSGLPGMGKNRPACDQTLYVGHNGVRATGEPSAVSCAACKLTEEFALALKVRNPTYDLPEPKPGG